MPTLFHHPFCPHSRFVRLALGEHSVPVRLIEERTWERAGDQVEGALREFLANPREPAPTS